MDGSNEPGSFIRIERVEKRYGAHRALDGVSFGAGKGHTLALLGPSGCGKTTMLRCIAGLETPDSGMIEIGGQTVFDSARGINLPAEERQLGIVFQSYAVWPHMTVAENVGFPLRVRRMQKADVTARVSRMLDIVGLGHAAGKSATQLSGGQQQRVALARALIHEPRLVLFDEALSNLDAALREHMRMELKVLQDRLGFTAIYVTHDQTEAFGLAERLLVMNAGRVETEGSPREVFRCPATPFIARFLGLNVLEAEMLRQHGERAEVRLPGGATLRGTLGGGLAPPAGSRVLACIRKEHVRLTREPDVPPLHAELRAASFLGLAEEYVLDIGGAELRAVQPPCGGVPGDRLVVTIRSDECVILLP
ncbi:ABC transporter ATP-binding protein [Roseomonas chloroacetimidivorans]|uniref:ABC transporter ATP-binding protein n=1 Tax=Roseomonas chloroacetimidivorans TaxID=1766656 RepID=UPI003C74270E